MANRLQYQNVALRLISNSYEEREFIASLFRVPDIKLHYTLRDDHAANIYSFVEYQAEVNARHRGFHFIIEDKTLNPVGILTAEVNQDLTGDPYWNVGFAVQPDARNKGYAKNALQGLQDQLSTFNIKTLVLDISTDNKAAEAVARSCGYEQRRSPFGGLVGYFDDKHPELGMRTQWIKDVHVNDPRMEAVLKANDAFKRKDYREAIKWYYQASEEPYQKGSIITDALLFSNLGMAYSSIREYKKAYMYLTKARNLGCQNASVTRELEWLRTHAADQI